MEEGEGPPTPDRTELQELEAQLNELDNQIATEPHNEVLRLERCALIIVIENYKKEHNVETTTTTSSSTTSSPLTIDHFLLNQAMETASDSPIELALLQQLRTNLENPHEAKSLADDYILAAVEWLRTPNSAVRRYQSGEHSKEYNQAIQSLLDAEGQLPPQLPPEPPREKDFDLEIPAEPDPCPALHGAARCGFPAPDPDQGRNAAPGLRSHVREPRHPEPDP